MNLDTSRSVRLLHPQNMLLIFVTLSVLKFETSRLVRRATDEEKPLAYAHGAIFLVFGLLALSQFAGVRVFWFWTWGGAAGCVRDGVLICIAMYMCALSAVWALAAFTSELYLRNFRRIETIRFQDEAEAIGATEAFAMVRRLQRTVRTCLLVEPILVFACVIPYRAQRMERSMLGVVADAARETAEECRGAGIRVIMITGDGKNTACAVARAAGLLPKRKSCDSAVLPSEQIGAMSDEELAAALSEISAAPESALSAS